MDTVSCISLSYNEMAVTASKEGWWGAYIVLLRTYHVPESVPSKAGHTRVPGITG